MTLRIQNNSIIRLFVWILLAFYVMFLVDVILLKHPLMLVTGFDTLSLGYRFQYANFVPLETIRFYLAGDPTPTVAARNLLGNILIFVPFGVLLPILFQKCRSVLLVLMLSFTLSLFFETLQIFFGFGSFDIDDILLNTIGGVLGYVIYVLVPRAFVSFRKRRKREVRR